MQKKAFNLAKKAAKNPVVREIGKMTAKELPKVYSKGVSKIKNKRRKKQAGFDNANMLVDSRASYVHDKLWIIFNLTGISNVSIEKYINEREDDDLKNNFVGVFSSNQLFRFISFHKLINEKKCSLSFYDHEYR